MFHPFVNDFRTDRMTGTAGVTHLPSVPGKDGFAGVGSFQC